MYTIYENVVRIPYEYTRILEMSTGPKFPARLAKFFSGPARNRCIIKFVRTIFFEILHLNQYNYIKLHSHFPIVQILYCPSTTVMYNVQLYQQRLKNFGSRGEHRTKFYKLILLKSCTAMASPKFLFGGTFSTNVLIKDF